MSRSTRSPSPLLAVSGLTLQRGRVTLLDRVDWTVNPGEHWVIMGPNGGGKTSLLRALTGHITPTAGTMSLLGGTHGATDWRELRRGVGLVSSALQAHIPGGEPALETVISGRYDQLDFWGRATPTDVRLGRRLLRQLAIGTLAAREWALLSQGERQRVLIARALAAAPRVLILDEPCAGLDPVARADFLTALQGLLATPRAPAVVLVTHHVEEIVTGFTHALVLSGGHRIVAGPLRSTLTTRHLSEAFGRPVRVRRGAKGWRLDLPA